MPQLIAGIVSPNERLRKIAIEAMSSYATNTDGAIEVVLKAVRDDLALPGRYSRRTTAPR